MGQHNIPAIASPLLQSSDTNLPSTIVERDANGDSRFGYAVGENGLKSLGSVWAGIKAKTTGYSITITDYAVSFDATLGNLTASLPAASTSSGQILAIKLTSASANYVAVDGNLSETIDGDLVIYLTVKNETVILQCDGTNWIILDRYIPVITTTKAAAFSVTGAANVYFTTEASAYTISLPAAAQWKGKTLVFTKVDAAAFAAVVDGNASESVNGSATYSGSTSQFRVVRIISDGSQWFNV